MKKEKTTMNDRLLNKSLFETMRFDFVDTYSYAEFIELLNWKTDPNLLHCCIFRDKETGFLYLDLKVSEDVKPETYKSIVRGFYDN